MKVTVSRSLLSDALRKVQGLASGKGALPILSNVKIEAADQKMKFTTTDLDLSVVAEITCNVVEGGAITLPAKLLSDAISRAAEGDVSIEVNEVDNKSIIKAGSSVFRITGFPQPTSRPFRRMTATRPISSFRRKFSRRCSAGRLTPCLRTIHGAFSRVFMSSLRTATSPVSPLMDGDWRLQSTTLTRHTSSRRHSRFPRRPSSR